MELEDGNNDGESEDFAVVPDFPTICSIAIGAGCGAIYNVIHPEAGHTWKRDSPSRYFRDKSNFLRDVLLLFFIMPTYSEDTITTALTAYRNGEYTSIRKCAYAFEIPNTTLSERLRSRISRSKSHEL